MRPVFRVSAFHPLRNYGDSALISNGSLGARPAGPGVSCIGLGIECTVTVIPVSTLEWPPYLSLEPFSQLGYAAGTERVRDLYYSWRMSVDSACILLSPFVFTT